MSDDKRKGDDSRQAEFDNAKVKSARKWPAELFPESVKPEPPPKPKKKGD